MPQLIHFPSTRTITQADLENILQLDAQIERLQRNRDRIAAGILHRMAEGQPVEDGPRSADVEVTIRGKVRKERLEVR